MADIHPEELGPVMAGNARRVYRLDDTLSNMERTGIPQ
jgi:hypothetical protein